MIGNLFHVSKSVWEKRGDEVMDILFEETIFYHRYNDRARRATEAAKYWIEDKILLQLIISQNALKRATEKETVAEIMRWVNNTYPSSMFYTHDKSETWNRPRDTMISLETRQGIIDRFPTKSIYNIKRLTEWTDCLSTDCDDYALLLYGLFRAADIHPDRLRICFMKTTGEWHLNVMYLENGKIPYAIEGTYLPGTAITQFGKTTYMNLQYNGKFYYEWIWILFNERKCWKHKYYKREYTMATNEVKSRRWVLNKEDLIKIGKSFLISLGGFVLTYLTDLIPTIEWGEYKPIVVAVSAWLINLGWKFLRGNK